MKFKKVFSYFSNNALPIVLIVEHIVMEAYHLIKYLQENADSVTAREVEEWISLSDENRALADEMYYLLFINDRIDASARIDIKETYREFREKYMTKKPATSQKATPIKTKNRWGKVPYVAAIALLFLISGLFLSIIIQGNNRASFTVSTKLGERAVVRLPDGTQAQLNACSDLTYAQTFFPRKRYVTLKGEAYFDVAHKASFPFVVSTDDVEIEVLGTEFNVRNNADERYITTILVEGTIHFKNTRGDADLQMKPGEELVFDKNFQQYHLITHANPGDAIGWIDGRLVFRNVSLQEIANSLERNYNVRFHFTDEKVKNERFNADFEIADNIYQILSVLELTSRFSYEIDNRDITISSK